MTYPGVDVVSGVAVIVTNGTPEPVTAAIVAAFAAEAAELS